MTSQNTKIKELLNQIEVLLDKTPPRLPWVMAGDVDQQRKILEETRDYLRSLEPQLSAREGYAAPPALGYGASAPAAGAGESAQQVLQAVLQEMNYLRSSVMQTMRSDIDSLQQQRDTLAQEVRFLEAQRQQYLVPQQQMNQQLINDFLQTLMSRLQENLTDQVSQMMMNMQLESQGNAALEGQNFPSLPGEAQQNAALPSSTMAYQGLLTPSQRLEHIQRVQTQSDQLLLKLDSTLKVIFESLHQNLQGYEESLGQGLDKMHRLGQQGEAMFAALVNRLAQQLGRDASAYLQSSIESSVWEAAAPFLPPDAPSARPEPSEAVTESQIDYLLNQLNRPQAPNQATEPGLSADLENVELETDPPIFDLPDDDGQLTLFQNESDEQDAGNLTLLQPDAPPVLPEPDESVDLDAAFDLLNQFTDEPGDTPEPSVETSTPVETPESLYGELDLYESMFGSEGDAVNASPPEAPAPVDESGEAAIALPDSEAIAYSTDEAFPNEFEEALFDGLVDPAQPVIDETAPDLPQANEEISVTTSYLFGEADDDLDAEGWQEIPDDELKTAALFETQPAEPAETISSLSDLITPTEDDEAGSVFLDEGTLLEEEALSDESYEAAAPDEDLLEPDQLIESTPFDLTLTSNTLSQLSADLSSLEGLDEPDEPEEWELSDFAVTAPPDEPPPVEPLTPTLDAPTDEVLAEYFNGFDADDGLALPEEPRADEVDLLFADAPDLSSLLEEPISPEELESLEADDEEFELPATELEESEFSDSEALKALLAEDDADWNQPDPQLVGNDAEAESQSMDDDDELLAAVRSTHEETIPGVDAMLASPTEDVDPDTLFSSVDASIDALPNLYSPDDLPFLYEEPINDAGNQQNTEPPLEANIEELQEPQAPLSNLPLDMTGDATLQDLFGEPGFDEPDEPFETAVGESETPTFNEPSADNTSSLTLESFLDSLDKPEVTSEANLDEYEVVGNSYASFLNEEPPTAQDTLGDWLGAAPDEPLDELEPEFDDLAAKPVSSSPVPPSEPTIDDLFATDDPDELFEVDALIEQVEQEDEANAFTLEGLGSLFEDLPDYEPDVYPIPSPGNPRPSNGQMPEGKFTESDPSNQSETPEKKSP